MTWACELSSLKEQNKIRFPLWNITICIMLCLLAVQILFHNTVYGTYSHALLCMKSSYTLYPVTVQQCCKGPSESEANKHSHKHRRHGAKEHWPSDKFKNDSEVNRHNRPLLTDRQVSSSRHVFLPPDILFCTFCAKLQSHHIVLCTCWRINRGLAV